MSPAASNIAKPARLMLWIHFPFASNDAASSYATITSVALSYKYGVCEHSSNAYAILGAALPLAAS